MKITCDVQLHDGDNFAYTPEQAAAQLIAALGGSQADDYATVNITQPIDTGNAGTDA